MLMDSQLLCHASPWSMDFSVDPGLCSIPFWKKANGKIQRKMTNRNHRARWSRTSVWNALPTRYSPRAKWHVANWISALWFSSDPCPVICCGEWEPWRAAKWCRLLIAFLYCPFKKRYRKTVLGSSVCNGWKDRNKNSLTESFQNSVHPSNRASKF